MVITIAVLGSGHPDIGFLTRFSDYTVLNIIRGRVKPGARLKSLILFKSLQKPFIEHQGESLKEKLLPLMKIG